MSAAKHTPADPEGLARRVAGFITDKAFVGRTGHGGGPCSSRVLRRPDLNGLIQTALLLYESQRRLGAAAATGDSVAEHDALIDMIRSLLRSYDAGLGVTLPKLWLADARAAIARAERTSP